MSDDQSSLRPPVRPTPVDQLPKVIDYVLEENSILHEKIRKLEDAIQQKDAALARLDAMATEVKTLLPATILEEREACAKLAQDYGISRYHYEQEPGKMKQDAFTAANSIAALIRGRGET